MVGQGPTAFAVGEGGGCLDVFAPVSHFSSFSLSGRRSDIDFNTVSRAIRPQNNQPNVAALASFLTTQKYAMLEYVNQKMHDVRKNKANHVCL